MKNIRNNLVFFLMYISILNGQEWIEINPTLHPEGNYDVFNSGHFINNDTGWCSDLIGGSITTTNC